MANLFSIAANQSYFTVSEDERVAIQVPITNKLRATVQDAFGTQHTMSGEVSPLVAKIGVTIQTALFVTADELIE